MRMQRCYVAALPEVVVEIIKRISILDTLLNVFANAPSKLRWGKNVLAVE